MNISTKMITIIVSPSSDVLPQFDAHLVENDGSTTPLVSSKTTPFLSSARALLRMGYDPSLTLIMRHAGSQTVALRANLGRAAKLRIRDDDRGIRLEKYDSAFSA